MSLSANYPALAPNMLLDFANTKTVDPRITVTRASTATYFDQLGVLQTAQNNVPRIDFNPTTYACNGLLVEEQRTNSIRNSTMVGAVAGTPGTAPTNWGFSTGGVTIVQVVGTGTENGIAYIDYRFQGTGAADSWNLIYDTSIVATNGQTWAGSIYLKLVGGSTANLPFIQRLVFRNSGFANIQQVDSSALTPTNAGLATQRNTISLTATQATTAFVTLQLNSGTPTGAYDITLRIGLPQLELGAFATSVIPTSTVAVTRQADAISMTGTAFSGWYNAVEGAIYAQASTFDNTNTNRIYSINDNTTSNVIRNVVNGGTLFESGTIVNSGVTTTIALTNYAPNIFYKRGFAYKLNDSAYVRNGAVVGTSTSINIPTGINRLIIGGDLGFGFINGWIQRIAYYPLRNTNAQLQALTGT